MEETFDPEDGKVPMRPASTPAGFITPRGLTNFYDPSAHAHIRTNKLFFGGRANQRLGRELALQQQGRQAVVRFLEELQEGMELLPPQPCATRSWALVRDRAGRVCWFHQIPSADGARELVRHADDASIAPMFSHVKQLSFTSRGEGLVRVNLVLAEGATELALDFSVRLRNVAAAQALW